MISLLFHLKGKHLSAQLEVAVRLRTQHLLSGNVLAMLLVTVKAPLTVTSAKLGLAKIHSTTSELGVDSHLTVFSAEF